MAPNTFLELCKVLGASNLLRSTVNVSVREQVLVFCHIIGHNVRFRVIGGRFHRSIDTVHRYFKIVLQAILKLYKHVVKESSNSTPPEISSSRRFYPYFKDCIGAIDGTHVRASVPLEIQGRFRGRKDGTTQNVLAAVTFDLRFSYVLAGWEGTAHDSRILSDALSKPDGLNVPRGKYYLADAGYGIQNGILSPYRGVRYHLKEFSDHPPENEKELFNLRHSSLRTTVERAFGVLKKRFRVLDSEPFCCYVVIMMGKSKANDEKIKQFRWSKPMERVLLEILADEASKGNKPSSAFKPSSIARVVDAISERFGVHCQPEHVENHLKTMKSNWKTIQMIRGKSGFNWDDNLKMIIAGKKEYDEYVTVIFLCNFSFV
ncbi:uncharacterized protein LOC115679372 [Syzygium oleosum]|uniref:uncharacterized protein LOC115679372 n=1 Tax=Syzygium oleosum TaxID=219896 RepID=UPI0024B93565|nr:uncharacterized protein LOC115679372 [Syzygium oleosum]